MQSGQFNMAKLCEYFHKTLSNNNTYTFDICFIIAYVYFTPTIISMN